MAWVQLDDQIPRHEKCLRAGPAACWLWVCGIAHCQSQLTDGFISNGVLPMIGVPNRIQARKLADRLVAAGLFDKVDGGYQVHDYLEHNPSRHKVLEKRAVDAARKRGESASIPTGVVPESARPFPSLPIPAVPNQRSKHPIFRGQRFTVFDWQLEDLRRLLGEHTETFGLDEWFYELDQRMAKSTDVVPQRDGGKWLEARTLDEAQRRGLVVASSKPAPATEDAAAILTEIQRQDRAVQR